MAVTVSSPIVIAGCGPGHPDYVTGAVHQAVAEAEVLVGARHLLELFPKSTATRIPVGADIQRALDNMTNYAHRRMVVLVSGDSGLFSLARRVQDHFGFDHCRPIPGVSSVQVACARLGLDWHDLRVLSAHGRSPDTTSDELRQWSKIAILAGTAAAADWAADQLDQLGASYRAWVCENLTWDNEQVRQLDSAALRTAELASRTIILLIRQEQAA